MEIMDSVGFPGYVVPRCDIQQTVGCLSGAQIDLRQFQYTHTYQGIETKKGICRKRMCRKDDKKRGPEKSLLIPHRQTGRKATERKQQGERIVYNGKMKLPEGKNKNQPPNQTNKKLASHTSRGRQTARKGHCGDFRHCHSMAAQYPHWVQKSEFSQVDEMDMT